MKKILTLIFLSVFCINVINAAITWKLSDDGTILTISGTGDINENTFNSAPWHSQLGKIKKVIIENGVTSIRYHAFHSFSALCSITIPNSMISIDDDSSLKYCPIRKVINFSSSDISSFFRYPPYIYDNVYVDGDFVIYNDGKGNRYICDYLGTDENITIPNGIYGVAEYAFWGCSNIFSVTIPNSVTSLCLSECIDLTSVNIPNSVTTLDLSGCQGLTSVTIPNSVTNLNLSGCRGLTSVTIPNSVTSLDLSYCSGLTSVTIPNSVTSLDLSECSGLTSLDIPNSVTSLDLSYCSDITSLEIPNSVTTLCLAGCSGLTALNIPNSVTSLDLSECSGLTSLDIPNSVTSLCLSECRGLTSIEIPNSVTNIEPFAFSGCLGITSAIIPYGVTTIPDNAFWECKNLISVTIPNSVTSIGDWAFKSCTSLESLTIPNSVTYIGDDAFANCPALNFIQVESENAYYDSRDDCNAIIRKSDNSLILGCCNTIIPNSVTYIDRYAFAFCKRLTSITIPNGVTYIFYGAFGGTGLTSITIPNSVLGIDFGAFGGCIDLKTVTINVNSCLSMSNEAFVSSGVEQFIMVGEALPVYVDEAFASLYDGYHDYDFAALDMMTIHDAIELELDDFYNNVILNVPYSLYDEYCSTYPWNKFANIVVDPNSIPVPPIDEPIILIDGETYADHEYREGQEISYIRNFGNTKWQALYVPFYMSYDDWKDDFDVAYINGIRQIDTNNDNVIDETIMDVFKIEEGTLIPNTPYLIRAKSIGEKNISLTNATIYWKENNSIDCSTTIAKYIFTGTYNTIPASTLIENDYYAMGGGSIIMTDGESDLKPFRWYLHVEARSPMYYANNNAKAITIRVAGEDEETTGICQLQMTNDELPVCDLNGRRVNENNLKPGIYVKNGKKVIVK